MSRWPGKYVIGLTGNIGTGKSTVLQMMEGFGAFGIDADGLVHSALAPGRPAYGSVVQTFGPGILAPDGQIDRKQLASIVFSDPAKLAKLEAIIHPIVREEIVRQVSQAPQLVILIEAIKLLESGLPDECDAVWVVDASPEQQLARLTKNHQMTSEQAAQRMSAQAPQAEKVARADLVITNDGLLEDTRNQVRQAWSKIRQWVEPMERMRDERRCKNNVKHHRVG